MEKKYLLNPPQQPDVEILDSLLAEMVLDKALINFRKEQIQKEIDQSLQDKNKEEFLRLTEELKNISLTVE
ncbi:IDEAL domain-containing protein [Bacillus sp. F19]|nr:IDEAL domain-containing protein [Bacillus sp. F19]